MAQLSVRHKQNLEREADELKHEEARLRDHLLQAQRVSTFSCNHYFIILVSGTTYIIL